MTIIFYRHTSRKPYPHEHTNTHTEKQQLVSILHVWEKETQLVEKRQCHLHKVGQITVDELFPGG